jgi:hypothetical protein
MTTYKKLGCKMRRSGTGWEVSGGGGALYYADSAGNKGRVMAEALKAWEQAELVRFIKATGWIRCGGREN